MKEKNECGSSAGFKPSLVCSILVAVSAGTAAPTVRKRFNALQRLGVYQNVHGTFQEIPNNIKKWNLTIHLNSICIAILYLGS